MNVIMERVNDYSMDWKPIKSPYNQYNYITLNNAYIAVKPRT